VIVRWSLAGLPDILGELGVERPFLITSRRWERLLDLSLAGRFLEVPSVAVELAAGADGLLAVGGGSAIDTAKHASAESGLPLVSVPTTYSGAEWTPSYGIRTPERRIVGGGGGAHLAGIAYDVELTLDLPRAETVGTALNALNHCAAAFCDGTSDALAEQGARLISESLPRVVDAPHDRDAREHLLQGAAAAGEALSLTGLGLGHAIAQALGGTYGLPHGAMNALALPPALRFNSAVVHDAVARFGAAIGAPADPAAKVEELARLGGFERLRDFGIPEDGLPAVAEMAAGRMGNKRNPRPASAAEIEELLRTIY
jgi:maleylacetate reductase